MSYLTAANFRPGSVDPACAGLALTDAEAEDPDLTSVITAISQRVDQITNDHFEKLDEYVLDVDVFYPSDWLLLSKRCTSVTTVKTRDHTGTLTTQPAAAYRLRSSLNTAGDTKTSDVDYLELLGWGIGITGTEVLSGFEWPVGAQTVQVTGDFGWTVTPGDIKRATALLVWDVFMREAGDVRRASRWARGDLTVERASDSMTGMPEADDILKGYRYALMGVG